MEDTGSGYLVLDATGRIIHANARMEQIIGEQGRGLVGKHTSETVLHIVDPTGRRMSREELPGVRVLHGSGPLRDELLGFV
ncbi:MAG: PAS domain-containing protein, partial [Leptospiraceae bacterium]|nr:PAS domain-containing protein [Leptospiraceae bacterium]